ncbi:MAG: hypothetical protein ACQEXJ_16380 [Myxococcota bacterium]
MIGTVFVLAIVLGVLAFRNYRASERHIQQSMAEFDEMGVRLDADGCVAAVLDWNGRCEAMKTLCDHAVPMAMEHCLAARDRSEVCDGLGDTETARAQWTYHKCEEHDVTRANKKACTNAYRALIQYCTTGQQGVIL